MRLVRIDVRPWTHVSVRFLETRLHPVDPAGCIESSIVNTVCLLGSLLRLSFVLLISFYVSLLAYPAPCKISHYVGLVLVGLLYSVVSSIMIAGHLPLPFRLFCYCMLRY